MKDPLASWPTVDEAAKKLKMSKRSLQLKLADRVFTTAQRPRPGKKPATVVDPSDIERYLNQPRMVKPAVIPAPAASSSALATRPAMVPMPAPRPEAARDTPRDLIAAFQLEHHDILNLPDAVRLKGYPVRYLEMLNAAGKLPFYEVPGTRGRHVRRRELDQAIEAAAGELPIWKPRVKRD